MWISVLKFATEKYSGVSRSTLVECDFTHWEMGESKICLWIGVHCVQTELSQEHTDSAKELLLWFDRG